MTTSVQSVFNDPRLDRLLRASGAAVDEEIEHLIVAVAQPLVTSILMRHTGSSTALAPEDAQDIRSTISLRLICKLRALRDGSPVAILDFDKYVATLTYNAMNDHLRKAFPARARLKNRLKYTLLNDERLGVWNAEGVLACGLRTSRDDASLLADRMLDRVKMTKPMLARERPGDALTALFRALGGAVAFDALVAFTARIWHVVDLTAAPMEEAAAATAPRRAIDIEERQYLEHVWQEILDLRPMQRKALLLNLRSEESSNVVSLLIFTGVARFDEVAAAVDLSREALAALWNDLPLDDQRIASLLGITRQQVINLRKAARERLTRRTRNIG